MKEINFKLNSRLILHGLMVIVISSWTPSSISLDLGLNPTDSGDGKKIATSTGGGGQANHNEVDVRGVLTEVPRDRVPVLGREEHIRRTVEIHQTNIGHKPKNNTIDIAPAGEGKTMTAEAMARFFPPGWVMLKFDMNAFKGGSSYNGQENDKLKAFEAEVERILKVQGVEHVVIWIDEAHSIMELQDMVKSGLKEFLLGTKNVTSHWSTTTNESKIIEKDPALMDRFNKGFLGPLDRDARIALLIDEFKKTDYRVTPEVLDLLVDKAYAAEATNSRGIANLALRLIAEMTGAHKVEVGKINDRMGILKSRIDYLEDYRKFSGVKLVPDKQIEYQDMKLEYADLKSRLEIINERGDGTKLEAAEKKLNDSKIELATLELTDARAATLLEVVIIELEKEVERLKSNPSIAETAESKDRYLIDVEKAAALIERMSGGKFSKESLASTDKDLFLNLRNNLDKMVIGHDQAKDLLQKVLKSKIAPVESGGDALPGVILDGMPGNGKSSLAEATAKALGYEYKIFYMNEFSGQGGYEKAFGQGNGIVDSDKGGAITNYIKEHPKSIIEFAEFDQAHSRVQKELYKLKETGELTTGKNEPVNAKELILFVTMNISGTYLGLKGEQRRAFEIKYLVDSKKLFTMEEYEKLLRTSGGSQIIQEIVMKNLQLDTGSLTSALHSRFAGSLIPTDSLNRQDALKVARLEVTKRYVGHWKKRFRVEFTADHSVYKEMVRMTYDPNSGMRAFKPTMTEYITDPLIDAYIDDTQLEKIRNNGNVHLGFDKENGRFTLSTKDKNGQVEIMQSRQVPNYIESRQVIKEQLKKELEEKRVERNSESSKLSKSIKTHGLKNSTSPLALDAGKFEGKSIKSVAEMVIEDAQKNTAAAAADAKPGAAGKPVTEKGLIRRVWDKIWRK